MDNKTKESIQFSSVILYLSLIRDMAGIGPLKQAGELNSRLGELLKEVGFLLDNQTKYNAFFDISCFTLITQSEEFGLFTVSKAIEEELNRSVSPYRETFLKDMDINFDISSRGKGEIVNGKIVMESITAFDFIPRPETSLQKRSKKLNRILERLKNGNVK